MEQLYIGTDSGFSGALFRNDDYGLSQASRIYDIIANLFTWVK